MAQLDDKTLQNLNKRLKEMDEILASDYRKALDLGKAFTQGFSTEQIDAFLRKLGKINRADAAKLNVMFNLVDVNGNPITVKEAKRRIRQLTEAINKGKPVSVIGNSKIGAEGFANELKRYKDALSILGMSTSQQFDLISRNVKKVNNEVKGLRKGFGDMLPTLQRLASAFGIAFSVRGLAQFGKKLIETRGEFEIQFVAMKQIIGDVDAATKIWNQTMQQALQSPFKAMQLVTYTKQLAAYRIETEKLFDTTKRLADISAGLGVDMGRLILAYGQVKSANFLRASEVRQFTEAGVNIAGGLAKYFTELEGRAVGTAEVMERITKRMVLFSDVEEVFKRMTDEGGEFYNMQEVQADTVKGQINKLHDAYDQMLNTIGQANQGTIRDLVDALNNLVRHWRDIASFIMKNVNAMVILVPLIATFRKGAKLAAGETFTWSRAMKQLELDLAFAGSGMKKFSLSTALGTSAVYLFKGAVEVAKTALKTFVPLLAIEGILWLVTKLQSANRELENMKKELSDLASESTTRMNEEIRGYELLIEKLKQTTEGTMARKEVIDEISQKYGKYLDFIVTEKTTIEELAGAYDNVVSSIRNYTAEKIRDEQQQRLEKGMYDEHQNLVNFLSGRTLTEKGRTSKLTKDQAKQIVKLIESELEKNPQIGTLDIYKVIRDYLGKNISSEEGMTREFQKFINKYTKLKKEIQDIRDDIESNTPVFATEQDYKDYKKNVDAAEKAIQKQNESSEEQINYLKEATRESEEQWIIDDRIAELRLANEEKILEIRKQYGLLTEDQYKQELARLHGTIEEYESDYNTRLENRLISKYGIFWENNKEARDMYNFVVSTEQALQQGTTQRNKQLIDTYKGLKDSLEQYKKALEAALTSGAGQAAIEAIQANIDTTVLHMTAIEEYAAVLRGLDLSDKKKTPRGHQENASKLISLIKEMRGEYDKLSKSAYGYAKSEEKVRDAYKDSVKEILGKAGITDYDFTTNEGMIKALEKVKSYATKLGKDAAAEVQKYIDQLETEIEINAQVKIRKDFGKQIEEMFSNYDLTIDLEKLNVPTDELVGIFNLDVTTLDELRRFVDDFYNKQIELGNNPTELVEQVEGYYKKIDEMEKKELRERLKTYSKYLAEGQVEALKIHLEELKKMAELDKLYEQGYFTDTQYNDISNKIRKETDEKLAKNDWQQFKESDFYVTMFEDMSRVSSESIDIMIKRLKSLRKSVNDLNPKQAKEIVKAIEKLEKAKLERSPLKSFLDDWKTAAKWRKDNDNLVKQLGFYASGDEYWSKEQDKQSKRVAELRLEYEELVKNGTPEDAADVKKRLDFEEEELSRINEILEDRRQKLDQINQEQNEGYAAQQRVLAGLAQGAQYFSDLASTAGTISTEIMDMFDGVSDATKKYAKDIAEIATNVGMLAADIAKAIASEGTDVGSMIDGIVRTWNIIKGALSASERDINETIEESTNSLKDLEAQLERISRIRERAWDSQTYTLAQKELENNIQEQIKAYDAMIAAEEERKNKDEEQIRTWKQEREDLFEQLEDETETLLKEFGGLGESEYKSAAQGFVDAWKSAFLETGDGLQGLQDHFDEFLNEWFVKQATMRVAGKMLEPLFRDIDNAVEKYGDGGTSVMMSELAKVRERFGIIAPELSDALEELTSLWGLGGEGSLSGLAAGIQGMTEEQANILEAYWNSVRGYTANIDMNVSRIAQILGAGGDNSNPMLAQMTLVAQNTNNINTLLQSVTKSGHSQGGYGIKVFAN